MLQRFLKWFSSHKITLHGKKEINPDEIFLDSSNLPQFDRHQFEGRLERPIARRTMCMLGGVFFLTMLMVLSKTFSLQIREGDRYANQSAQNRLRYSLIFGSRGVFYDRNGTLLAWNIIDGSEPEFSKRKYLEQNGLSHVLGFIKYPSKDKAGFYYKVDFEGLDGAEKYYNEYVSP